MRGEYLSPCHQYIHLAELPPRARRILFTVDIVAVAIGTTSACAENTGGGVAVDPGSGNYLRVRGEYWGCWRPKILSRELPPRARRIRVLDSDPGTGYGTTSACAENTKGRGLGFDYRRNYLRVRGEYFVLDMDGWSLRELPPRARRIRYD